MTIETLESRQPSANSKLTKAKKSKNDEFYTQYSDIEKEISAYLEFNADVFRGKTILLPCDDPGWSNFTKYFAQNFDRFGLKKLISTSYAAHSKGDQNNYRPSPLEINAPQYDPNKSSRFGKIFTLTHDSTGDNRVDVDDLEWTYLAGDGDFRSDEVKVLRNAADIIITNPPFSLFREFLTWIVEADKQFVIVGHQNAITYKEVFPLIKNNRMWLGKGFSGGAGHFINTEYEDYATATDRKEGMIRVSGVHWFSNFDHGRRHQPLKLMTMQDNLRFNKKMQGKTAYDIYDNYDAIEVPFTNAIPSDYDGVMGVPITFLDKYCPEQFEIIGSNLTHATPMSDVAQKGTFSQGGPSFYTQNSDGTYNRIYTRVLIKHKDKAQ